tara:strand:+ start:5871 stop:6470 length:600 start_codon:yes stop_codon:yes gene_type:complete
MLTEKFKSEKMEYSCYYVHFNQFPVSIVYVKKEEDLYILITCFEDDDEVTYYTNEYVIKFEELKEFPILYEDYILSLLLTNDISDMKKDEYNHYYIDCGVNWKKMRFTKKGFTYTGFDTTKHLKDTIDWEMENDLKKDYDLIKLNRKFMFGSDLYILQKEKEEKEEKEEGYVDYRKYINDYKEEKTIEELDKIYEKYKK